ncbi:MAG: RNA polymerase factor sigma-54 [Phycisphaerales bacterium]|nr:RNA polymerase factor sigma-54 [Phycisphaerales bacterium]
MKLAPRMIQSMEILQMPLADLQERIQQELENNAALEIAELDADATRADRKAAEAADLDRPMEVNESSATDDFQRLEEYQEFNPEAAENEFSASDYEDRGGAPTVEPSPGPSAPEPGLSREDDFGSYSPARMDGERDAKLDAMAAAPARSASLTEQLQDQWALSDVEDRIRAMGDIIIPYIEEDGYVRTPLATIADRVPASSPIKPTAEGLEHGLRAVQLLIEPAGIGARDVRECLLLQLDAMEDSLADEIERDPDARKTLAAARRIIEGYLDDLTQNRLPRISERTGLSLDEIKAALVVMRKLSISPARRLVDEASRPIVPDAIVEYDADEDRYIAYLNEGRIPNLRVNQEYAHMSKDLGVDKQSREFLKTSLGNAHWLIDAVNQRKRTLLRVVKAVVEAQREYFDYGPQATKPLPMTQVAEQLGIHVATVSRAVSEKYLQTPRGVVPLRKFFTGGTQTDEGEDVSWEAIRAALKDVIDAEDKAKPLSDEALADELKKHGLEIARRTVAKYREQMGIPTARLRKTF